MAFPTWWTAIILLCQSEMKSAPLNRLPNPVSVKGKPVSTYRHVGRSSCKKQSRSKKEIGCHRWCFLSMFTSMASMFVYLLLCLMCLRELCYAPAQVKDSLLEEGQLKTVWVRLEWNHSPKSQVAQPVSKRNLKWDSASSGQE